MKLLNTFKTMLKGKTNQIKMDSPLYLEGKKAELEDAISLELENLRECKTNIRVLSRDTKKAVSLKNSYVEEAKAIKTEIEKQKITTEEEKKLFARIKLILPKIEMVKEEIEQLDNQSKVLETIEKKHELIINKLRESLSSLTHNISIIESKRRFSKTIESMGKNGSVDLDEIDKIMDKIDVDFIRSEVKLDMMDELEEEIKVTGKTEEQIFDEIDKL